jgi:beta-glucosidase
MKSRYFVMGIILLFIAACTTQKQGTLGPTSEPVLPEAVPTQTPVPPTQIPTPDHLAEVEELLSQMSIDEKIGQMAQISNLKITPEDIGQYYIGSIIGGGDRPADSTNLGAWYGEVKRFQDAALSTRLGIPMFFAIDAIHGNANLHGATVFPHEIGLGATRDAELVQQIGQATAEEILAAGYTMNLSPILAVPQDIRWGRTDESYSENTELVSELGSAYIKGLQSLPPSLEAEPGRMIYVLATSKHFLGDGGTTAGTSTWTNNGKLDLLDQGDCQYNETDTRNLFLPPYEAAVDEGVGSVMASYSSWNGVKMHAQKPWLTDVLKDELGFDGFIISDMWAVDQVDPNYYKALVTSINAGIDMVMVPFDYVGFTTAMKRAVMKGDISMERLDDAVRRILLVKYESGLFDHPYGDPSLTLAVGSPEHRELARKAVSESLVLIKNKNGALPIDKTVPKIYIAGVAADDLGIQMGGWTINWQGGRGDIQPGTTILDGIKQVVSASTTVEYNPTGQFIGKAEIGIAVVGELPYAEGFGDTANLKLSARDAQLIRTMRSHSEKLIVILISGRPMVITPQFDKPDAWVAAWLPGTEGEGVADVLFGDKPFTGKSPYTWPRNNSQLPININTVKATEGCDAPLFPYGYGLTSRSEEITNEIVPWGTCPGDK